MTDDITRIRREFIRQEARVKPKLSKKTADAFNFGACMLPVLYNLIYKRYHLAAAFLVMTAIPHIVNVFLNSYSYLVIVFAVSILSILLALYSGVTGNSDTYNARDYDDERDFILSQRGWNFAAVIALIVHICILGHQINGHYNIARMIDFANAKNELKTAIRDGAISHEIIGITAVGQNIPIYFSKYIKGKFDEETGTIRAKSGYKYTIEGFYQDCFSRKQVHYHEKLTSCAIVYVDVNGDKGPNLPAVENGVDGVKDISRSAKRLNDIFTLYVYNDDLAPKEESIEEYALRKFERK